MCLITTQKKPLIADKDMVVYKTLQDDLRSVFTYFQYTLGHLHKQKIKSSSSWSAYDDGDAGWLDGNYPGWRDLSNVRKKLKCLGAGFHSALSKDRLYVDGGEVTVKCVVPKGSEYYVDATGLCISNQIIIKEIVSENKEAA